MFEDKIFHFTNNSIGRDKTLRKPRWYLLFYLAYILLVLIILYVFYYSNHFGCRLERFFYLHYLPIFIAAFFTYLLHPLVEKLHRTGLHRGIAIIIIYVIFFGGIGYSIYLGIPILIEQIKDLSDHIPEFANHYRNWVENLHDSTSRWPDGMKEQIEGRIDKLEIWLSGFLSNAINH